MRIGLHTGTPLLTEEGYVGDDVHRAARIAAAGHGGQVLVSSSTAQLVEIELTDLGEHRFKDLGAPERVYQLGAASSRRSSRSSARTCPCPRRPSSGRERELAEVVGLLEGTRLLTLTGPGGTGKTRLAATGGRPASDGYPDGVWWVPLAPLREPDLVLETAAQVVGSKNGLAEHIADKSMLLLFDNFEQVVEAAGEVARAARLLPQPRRARHEPGAAARDRRAGVPCAAARARGGRRFLHSPGRGRCNPTSSSTAAVPRSAAGSTTCHSRSSWPPPA